LEPVEHFSEVIWGRDSRKATYEFVDLRREAEKLMLHNVRDRIIARLAVWHIE
jgi:hypothetical protein